MSTKSTSKYRSAKSPWTTATHITRRDHAEKADARVDVMTISAGRALDAGTCPNGCASVTLTVSELPTGGNMVRCPTCDFSLMVCPPAVRDPRAQFNRRASRTSRHSSPAQALL